MNKIKICIILIVTALFIGLCTTIGIQRNNLNKAKIKLEQSEINYLALENECNKLTNDNIEYQLTVTQLSLSQDSLTSALNRARINLGIKDKEIKRLGYIASQAQKTDTLYIRDSIFLNNVNLSASLLLIKPIISPSQRVVEQRLSVTILSLPSTVSYPNKSRPSCLVPSQSVTLFPNISKELPVASITVPLSKAVFMLSR